MEVKYTNMLTDEPIVAHSIKAVSRIHMLSNVC